MGKEAQIREIIDILIRQPLVKDGVYKTAEALYAAGYRKLLERPKVLSGEEIREVLHKIARTSAMPSGTEYDVAIAQAQLEADIRHYEKGD